MSTSCLFGIIVFAPNSTIIYRFLSDDLYEHIIQGLKKKGLACEEHPPSDEQVCRYFIISIPHSFILKNDEQSDHQEHRNSIDDDLPVYFSTLLRVQDQALLRHDPIKQIKLETGLRVFYDQVNNSTENSFAFH